MKLEVILKITDHPGSQEQLRRELEKIVAPVVRNKLIEHQQDKTQEQLKLKE